MGWTPRIRPSERHRALGSDTRAGRWSGTMIALPFDDRKRAYGLAGAIAIHLLAIALVVLLSPPLPAPPRAGPGLVALQLDEPPPPPAPPPAEADEGAAAPPSRGATKAPSPPEP